MSEIEDKFWFPVKRHGWGWGLPVRWQGWAVLAAYIGLIPLAGGYFRARDSLTGLLVFILVDSVLLIVIVALKGEKPLGWRWGK